MEAKQIVREAMRLAYTPQEAAKWKRSRSAYSVGWMFDAGVVMLLVVLATLYFAA